MVYVIHALVPEWSDEMRGKKCKRKNMLGRSERKKKVALVSGKNLFICYISSQSVFASCRVARLGQMI